MLLQKIMPKHRHLIVVNINEERNSITRTGIMTSQNQSIIKDIFATIPESASYPTGVFENIELNENVKGFATDIGHRST